MVRFDLGPLVQGQTAVAKLKSAHISLIIGPRGLGYESNLQENMCWEPFDVVRFDLGALVQGQMTMPKLKSVYISLIFGPSSNLLFSHFLHSYNMVGSLEVYLHS